MHPLDGALKWIKRSDGHVQEVISETEAPRPGRSKPEFNNGRQVETGMRYKKCSLKATLIEQKGDP